MHRKHHKKYGMVHGAYCSKCGYRMVLHPLGTHKICPNCSVVHRHHTAHI